MPPDCAISGIPESFAKRKSAIVASLATSPEEYDDLSPKGSIDEAIRPLIQDINALEGFITTSSCAGRISVFAEGIKKRRLPEGEEDSKPLSDILTGPKSIMPGLKVPSQAPATVGGKGGGGTWLYVSHDPVKRPVAGCALGDAPLTTLFNLSKPSQPLPSANNFTRFVHFKFEAMILHVLTGSLAHAQRAVSAAMQAGFRESGIQGVLPNARGEIMPMVGIRSTALALDCVVGIVTDSDHLAIVNETYLQTLLEIANEKFKENHNRINRFRELLIKKQGANASLGMALQSQEWENADVRRQRKIAEGLERQKQLASRLGKDSSQIDDALDSHVQDLYEE
ncbi:MAG: hypothetical protein M1814_001372 [Vezdaea aestivalis]|nr:MAG: hypothetical protein M1814_001372 [Vezdaea aestivalis]